MKIKFIDNLTFNVYIRKEEIKNINVKSKKEIETYLKTIINKLRNIYYLNIEGFYNIKIYIDNYYGIIINFNKEKLDYYDYFNGGIELDINIIEVSFLYKVDDIPKKILKKLEMNQIDDDIYIKIVKELDQKEFMNLIEHTEKIIKI